MEFEARGGLSIVQDGADEQLRLSRLRALVTVDAHGRYFETTFRGCHYGAVVASVAPGTAVGTTPAIALWNPPSSGVILVPTIAEIGYVSGTIGAGYLAGAMHLAQTAAPTGGTESTTFSNILNGTKGRGRAFTGSTTQAATQVGAIGSLQPTLATAPAAGGFAPFAPGQVALDGRYIVPPGVAFSIQGVAAAGTTPLVSIALFWEELPVAVP